ncbi:hypothetical protein CANARDRAFT_6847 [[Candida] arabinofermentans NRRL YB-2248]|uniref:DUF1746 domain-containing protein n=1 Tax=[Candida] arabinofermentans NRRL YB-2248 TaxID=983967 RepID=A0A1E4T3N3_9ASCO|nr:hypothetical protein CANARDRAFT_6847 [[Candida] arabinofermentans NRRL YB-2248]
MDSNTVPGWFIPITNNTYNNIQIPNSTSTTNLIKIKNNLKNEFLRNIGLLIIFEIIIIYLIDQSFINFIIKILLQLLLSNLSEEILKNWIEFNIITVNSTTSDNNDIVDNELIINSQINYFKKLILAEIIIVNLASFIDHFFFLKSVDFNNNEFKKFNWESIMNYLNENTKLSLNLYDNSMNWQYSSIFINMIGELKKTNNFIILSIDLLLFLFQLITYLLIFRDTNNNNVNDLNNSRLNSLNVDENTQLLSNRIYQDGYQGDLIIFKIDLFPKLKFNQFRSKFKFN